MNDMNGLNQRMARRVVLTTIVSSAVGVTAQMVVAAPRAASTAYSAGDIVQESAVLTAPGLNKLLCVTRNAPGVNVIRGIIAERLNAGGSDISVRTYWVQGNVGKHYFNIPVNSSQDLIILMFIAQGDYYYYYAEAASLPAECR